MPVTWVLVPYKRDTTADMPTRYVAINDFTPRILADGGDWSETEVAGPGMGWAIVKFRTQTNELLTEVCGTPGYRRFPKDNLADRLLGISQNQLGEISNLLRQAGYTQAEIDSAMGQAWSAKTLGDLARLWSTRRKTPRYDPKTDAIICDGEPVPCKSVDTVDSEVF